MKLNLGCGFDIRKDWTNCDIVSKPGVDVVFDMSKPPMPFETNSIDEILISGVLEHISNWETVVEECHRILKPQGLLTIIVPYGMDYKPYHIRFFNESTMRGFTDMKTEGYQGCFQYPFDDSPFEMVEERLDRIFWFGWHFHHYLGIDYWRATDPRTGCRIGKRYTFPIGKKIQLTWKLRKVVF